MKKTKIALIWKVLAACVLGCFLGRVLPLPLIRVFTTFNQIFSEYLSFIIPLIILGLVTGAICKIGVNAGKMLLFTVILAYASTVLAGFFSYGVSVTVFPGFLGEVQLDTDSSIAEKVAPFFTLEVPPFMNVTSALVFSFLVGTLSAFTGKGYLKNIVFDFEELVSKAITTTLIPLLPIFIFGIFLEMSFTGGVLPVMKVFAKMIIVIFAVSLIWLLFEFSVAGIISRKNPFKCFVSMLPAYLTALGTASSAATIPVTLSSTRKMGISEAMSNFSVPLCAAIHMPGSMMTLTSCAMAIMILQGMPFSTGLVIEFVMLLAITSIAAPGVPGGAIMAALGVLASVLGFNEADQGLMITLYIVMDSFATACNVTSDGAVALIVNKLFHGSLEATEHQSS